MYKKLGRKKKGIVMYLKLKKSIEESMKKQIFLLAFALLAVGTILPTCATTSCSPCATTCSTPCATSCDNLCTPEHGHTYLQVTPHFQAASPELVSDFNSNVLYNLEREDKHGAFEVVVFGGKSTKASQAAAYFLPCGHSSLTFDGRVTLAGSNLKTFARVLAESDARLISGITITSIGGEIGLGATATAIAVAGTVNGLTFIETDSATYQFDSNKDTSKILPWNFGITFAALFEPRGSAVSGAAVGSALVTSPAFLSTICPTLTYSHVGAGLALRYHFSDDKNGWWGLISTAVQNVRSNFCLNEDVTTEATAITAANFPAVDVVLPTTTLSPYGVVVTAGSNGDNTTAANANAFVTLGSVVASATPTGSINAAYIGSGFPNAADAAAVANATRASSATPPANVTEAFANELWNYGKVCGCQKITRLADIELSLGYQWMCGDCASTNWYLGVVIPTGNKPCATYIAPAVVGNGQHAGIMTGSCTEVMLSEESDYSAWYRIDACARYLFRNTQKRSFDLCGNEWSRYMMVWENETAYSAAITAMNAAVGTIPAYRTYEYGINVFTTDFYIKPQFQGRLNQAVYFQGEHFRAELGWNIFARQTDCVQLACDWTALPAFADSSYLGGVALNNNRTIYNDSQTTAVNVISTANRINAAATAFVPLDGITPLAATAYDDFAITQDEIEYNSVATPGAIVNTPYLTLGYAFESDYKPQLSVGGSYEFTTRNSALNQWLVWGKFELAF
ncbi:hypothetical protein A3J41_01885 [candidate division TM6 bacterium RIFCSPHIGHO2_12_FULL_38_8]|nr:MAG: hypothetical protein A3J41_01885 [candidate division TM6 bacterium RIFCSPHIGHO2_12_FULL_38_8]